MVRSHRGRFGAACPSTTFPVAVACAKSFAFDPKAHGAPHTVEGAALRERQEHAMAGGLLGTWLEAD